MGVEQTWLTLAHITTDKAFLKRTKWSTLKLMTKLSYTYQLRICETVTQIRTNCFLNTLYECNTLSQTKLLSHGLRLFDNVGRHEAYSKMKHADKLTAVKHKYQPTEVASLDANTVKCVCHLISLLLERMKGTGSHVCTVEQSLKIFMGPASMK